MDIYLIRHGKLNWEDNKKRCIGVTDIKLSEEGIEKAKEIAIFLQDKNISKIYTSDLTRCEDSARIISCMLNIPYSVENSLREINMGIWENKTFDFIKKTYPIDYEKRGKYIGDYKIQEGESFKECMDRSVSILKNICDNNDGNIAILTHSGVIKCIISYIQNININEVLNIKQNYGGINCISYDNNKFQIKYINK